MKEKKETPLQTLSEIKDLMERSSRFVSLSGLSGVCAGLYALVGAFIAYRYLNMDGPHLVITTGNLRFITMDALTVLVLALGTAFVLTKRSASKDGNSIFDATAQKLILNLSIPLVTGGVFCLALLYHENYMYVPAATLIFYGLALVHASSNTRNDIRLLGYLEIILGLIATFYSPWAFLFWVFGFGILHIVYGTYMYYKYER